MILLFGLLACHKPAEPPVVYAPPTEAPAPARSGTLSGGVYRDARYPLTVPLSEGWSGEPGVEGSELRFTAVHAATGTTLQAIALPVGATAPPERAECAWSFIDTGSYRDIAVPGPLTVATCTPRDPTGPRVFAVLVVRSSVVIDLELSVPNTQLAAGRAAGDVLLHAVRFEEPSGVSPP